MDSVAGGLPLVVVGVPSTDMVHADFASSLVGLFISGDPARKMLFNNKSSLVTFGRNECVATAKKLNAEWLLFLDSDMIFPPDILKRLLVHGKDIVGATYCKRVHPYEMLGFPLDASSQLSGLVEMSYMPTGCLLIRMSVFNRMKRPYFRCRYNEDTGVLVGEDYVFSDTVRDLGLQLWCDADLSRKVGHIGQRVVMIPTG